MGIKVAKFGGSSLCDAEQFKKVKKILLSDPDRHYVVPSAPGRRFKDDEKVTDLLYRCFKLAHSGQNYSDCFGQIVERLCGIVSDLGLDLVLNNNTPAPLWIHVRSWTEKEQTFAEVQIIGIPLEGSVRLETETTETPAPLVPVYIRDKEARYVTYTDEQEPVSAARPGVDAVTWRIHLNLEGEEISREILSQDHYEAIPARIYVGATER